MCFFPLPLEPSGRKLHLAVIEQGQRRDDLPNYLSLSSPGADERTCADHSGNMPECFASRQVTTLFTHGSQRIWSASIMPTRRYMRPCFSVS